MPRPLHARVRPRHLTHSQEKTLQLASTWNGSTKEEELIQLVDRLRGRALWEWPLLSDTDRSSMKSGIEALRNCLESGEQAMAVQDF